MNQNPLVNETAFSKIKTRFSSKKDLNTKNGNIRAELVGMNKAMDICALACACCWDKDVPDDYQGRAEYNAKRSRTGHTSILEHSNYVVYLNIPSSYTEEFIRFLDMNRYLHHRFYQNSNGDWCVLIGGSYRGYSDLYLNADDLNNAVLQAIIGNLYIYAHSAAFEDICKLGLMDKSKFMNADPDENFKILTTFDDNSVDTDLFSILGVDSIKMLYNNIYKIDEEFAKSLSTFDLLEFLTVSVLFKNMSRTCTHQLVRHRNAITQESQRYVDYSKSCFSSPALFKPGKYDPNHKYKIHFASSAPMYLTLQEIGDAICQIYGMLSNPSITGGEHALLREDARAFLPGNVQCRKIYMTFTFRNFFKFLQLREARGAQAEIRMYSAAVGEWFRSVTEFSSKEITDLYTMPRLLIEDPFKIDVDEGVEESVIEMTEEDYIKAAGLDREENE